MLRSKTFQTTLVHVRFRYRIINDTRWWDRLPSYTSLTDNRSETTTFLIIFLKRTQVAVILTMFNSPHIVFVRELIVKVKVSRCGCGLVLVDLRIVLWNMFPQYRTIVRYLIVATVTDRNTKIEKRWKWINGLGGKFNSQSNWIRPLVSSTRFKFNEFHQEKVFVSL